MDDLRTIPDDSQGKDMDNTSSVTAPNDAFLIKDMQTIPLRRAMISIGRRHENEVVIDDSRVSRYHAQLRLIDGQYILFDLHSTGGTFINGRRIEQSVIYSGDVISLAGVELIFRASGAMPRPDLKETDRF
jgi:pSer/pThr/pTyr-binding forkhead associated (FHA) protein